MNILHTLLVALFLVTIVSARFSVPCDRCVGLGMACGVNANGDQCANGLSCQTIPTTGVQACVEGLAPYDTCDITRDLCPYAYSCDAIDKICKPSFRFAGLNDGCIREDECYSGLVCEGSVCKRTDSGCSSDNHCPNDQYCSLLECTALPGNGEDCTLGGDCKNGFTCNDGKCIEIMSLGEGAECDDLFACEAGYQCKKKDSKLLTPTTCETPKYEFLVFPYDALWVGCEDTDWSSCTCNKNSKTYEKLVERTLTFHPDCKNRANALFDCMRENNCKTTTLLGTSCMRQNCRVQYELAMFCPSLNPSLDQPLLCGANIASFAVLLALAMLALL